ncbi:sugar MFS transporter [Luteolibacter sp. Populi]|uniref:MFS transporter n=1 Tax=Luteolibacter sp. Populi TaxID=3230487 RepID=UPI003465EA1A
MTTTLGDEPIAHNAKRLLWAGFLAILAAGIGFGVRGGILANWAKEFGFTGTQLGDIGGAGFTSFCFGIVIGGVIVDKIGYGKLVLAAFVFHIASALITFAAHQGQPQEVAYKYLYWGTFVFGLANGTLEAVANPLVATLFPKNRTHYLNILHASWPAGMVIGGVIGWTLGGAGVDWKIQLGLFLIPTILYGIAFLGQSFPKSEAVEKGLKLGEMFKEVGLLGGATIAFLFVLFFKDAMGLPAGVAWGIGGAILIAVGVITSFSMGSLLLFVLFITHALVGSVELGTDGWIQNITGNILTPEQGKQLFVATSALMFILRFSAHFIESKLKISPIGLLLICSILAVVGLNLVSGITTFAGALLALGVYALGKTFFWPTMLAVVGDRFPRTGAIAMSIMGGIGMMSMGLIGSPGLGYAKDRFTAEQLKEVDPAIYEANKAQKESKFLFAESVYGLDGTKLSAAQSAKPEERTPEQKVLSEASISGDRKTLKADSFIPAAMAVIYLLLLIYFKVIGGYRVIKITPEQAAGGVAAPAP